MKKTLSNIAKTMTKGGLHKSLDIPEGTKIPRAKIKAAANAPGKLGKQARLAETFAKHRPRKK
jgi:hypothetical protein